MLPIYPWVWNYPLKCCWPPRSPRKLTLQGPEALNGPWLFSLKLGSWEAFPTPCKNFDQLDLHFHDPLPLTIVCLLEECRETLHTQYSLHFDQFNVSVLSTVNFTKALLWWEPGAALICEHGDNNLHGSSTPCIFSRIIVLDSFFPVRSLTMDSCPYL